MRRLCPKCRQLEDARRNERVYPAVAGPGTAGDLPAAENPGEQISMKPEAEKNAAQKSEAKSTS